MYRRYLMSDQALDFAKTRRINERLDIACSVLTSMPLPFAA
jgi:hypothetical protein